MTIFTKSARDVFAPADAGGAPRGPDNAEAQRWAEEAERVLKGMPLGRRLPVRAVAQSNIAIATALNDGDSLDGLTLADDDLVLLVGQTDPSENGVWQVADTPVRASAEGFDEFDTYAGAVIAVQEGTAGANTFWFCVANVGGTIDVNDLTFVQMEGLTADKAFVYVAYASAADGTGFTTTFNAALDYIAILPSTVEIETPQASDFAGRWKNYKGAQGVAGKTVLNGTGAPAGGTGVDGDFYIDTATMTIYGPKASGSWPAGVALPGDPGPLAAAVTTEDVAGTTYTVVSGDLGKVKRTTNGSAVTVTLPNNLPQGFNVLFRQAGAGQITFAAASGATLHNRNSFAKMAGQWGEASLTVDANGDGTSAAWVLSGDCAA